MTDIVKRLSARRTDLLALAEYRFFATGDNLYSEARKHDADVMSEAADEITRLRSGLMKSVQYDNKCDQTGRSCREDGPCGCQKEAETWLEDE